MSYICSIKLKTVINMETKKFAEENAGKFFRFGDEIVKVVGYSVENECGVLISGLSGGWGVQYSQLPIIFVCKSMGKHLWWVAIDQLQPITDEEFATKKAGKRFKYVSSDGSIGWGPRFVTLCGYSNSNREDLAIIVGRQFNGWSSKMFAPTDKVLKESVYDSYWYVSQTDLEEVL